ncbi:MAG: hypothetical protein ACI83B_001656 [Sediminicola sp.]|jgi:hypothetical protein
MKTQTSNRRVESSQPNHALGIYILSITFIVAAFTVITAAKYL